ncbi:MAG: relaxase/mobilization nuclease domain-containing protein [Filifactoraceae bacterium]
MYCFIRYGSFKPVEITPEQAHKIAYELAMSFTKGKHTFVVATHNDKAPIHTHIDFNSTSIDRTKKFRDFKRSGNALVNISNRLCIEKGLSIIKNPLSHSDKLR